jgi:2-dehydro-3-deoxyphosphogluconate aldolase/(4S)-4-hydroxy-2-oxoglutarate aldolase
MLDSRLIAIVRYREGGDVDGAVAALVRGGVEVVEVTLDTPGALGVVARCASHGVTVGVGTVVRAGQVAECAEAGARFVVSPGLVPEVVEEALRLGVEPVPGVFTPTEVLAATGAGARVLKVFPAATGGPTHLRALRGPFPDAAFVPTGGVGIDDVGSYLDAGAAAVGLGGELVGRAAPRTDADLESIVARATRAVAAATNETEGST